MRCPAPKIVDGKVTRGCGKTTMVRIVEDPAIYRCLSCGLTLGIPRFSEAEIRRMTTKWTGAGLVEQRRVEDMVETRIEEVLREERKPDIEFT